MKRLSIVVIVLFAACQKQEGNPDRGKQLIAQYGCQACHAIPGVPGPRGAIGPRLEHVASRPTIGNKVPNTVENMTKWLQNPQAFDPANTMPNLGVTPEDARDLSAFLSTLK